MAENRQNTDELENADNSGADTTGEDQNTLENRKVDIQEYHKARLEGVKMNRRQFLSQKFKRDKINSDQKNKAQGSSKKTSKVDFVYMLMVAGFFDLMSFLLNLIPGLGGILSTIFITPAGTFTLWLMYKNRGMEFKSTKSMAKFGGASLIELIPVLNVLPGFILNVLINYGSIQAKEIVGDIVPGGKSLMN